MYASRQRSCVRMAKTFRAPPAPQVQCRAQIGQAQMFVCCDFAMFCVAVSPGRLQKSQERSGMTAQCAQS
eukprot:9295938-Lingulodinium_polyedra.AAC.1